MSKFKTFAASALLLLSVGVAAQGFQFPDPGFEDWSGATFDGKEQPKYWHFSNVEQFGFKFNFAVKENGRTGKCIYVQDKDMEVAGINGGTSPGYVALGQPWAFVEALTKIKEATAGCSGGINFTHRPDSVVIWIKRTGSHWADENYNLVFYSWRGTAIGTSYFNKGGDCTQHREVNEESDIRQALNNNECTTSQYATQVCEGYFFERKNYTNWTRIAVPLYYFNDSLPEKCNFIISSGNYPAKRANTGLYDGNAIYADDVELIYNSTAQKVFIGNREWKAFDPNNHGIQTYSLGAGVTRIPDIYCLRGAGQIKAFNGVKATMPGRKLTAEECVINTADAAVDGAPVTITITAEDGSSTSTYQIQFVSQVSNNPRLAGININGEALSNFNPYITTYNINLPFGTTEVPVVEATTQDAAATAVITQATDINGTATIAVTAQDGTPLTYTLRFTVAALQDVTLKDILVDGTPLDGFKPGKLNYTIEVPADATEAPAITPVSAYPEGAQQITVVHNTIAQGCRIDVAVPGTSLSQTYTLRYRRASVSSPYLSTILIDGDTLTNFVPTEAEYTLVLGDNPAPVITPVAHDSLQQIITSFPAHYGTAEIMVISATGETFTYRIQLLRVEPIKPEPIDSVTPNTLLGLFIDGYGYLDLMSTTETAFTIPLPYGTDGLHVTSWEKAYPAQQVLVAEGGILHPTTVTVLSGRRGEAKKVYTLTPQIAETDMATLTDLKLNGETISRFHPTVYSYVVQLDDATLPTVTFTAKSGAVADIDIQNTKRTTIVVEAGEIAHTYTIWWHYNAEVIPNADFSQSATARYNNAFKPAFWQVPADGAQSYSWGAQGTIKPQDEVKRNADGSIRLATTREKASNSIYGSIPGMMTLGTLSLNLTSGGGSTSSVSSGIKIHNTPDSVIVDAKPVSKRVFTGIGAKDMPNWRMLVTLNDQDFLYQGSYAQLGTWQTCTLPLTYEEQTEETELNITLNSSKSENAKDLGGYDAYTSELDVRNLRIGYSNSIKGLAAAGANADKVNAHSWVATVPSETAGHPLLSIIGDVEDQEHHVSWNSNTQATIRSYAEDGSYADYTLNILRTPSSDNSIGDTAHIGAKDFIVSANSAHARIVVDTLQGGFVVRVTSETDVIQQYCYDTIPQPKPYTPSAVSTLSAITINQEVIDGFLPDVHDYSLHYTFDEWTRPLISATATDSAATVQIRLTGTNPQVYTFVVTAEDKVHQTTYTLMLNVDPEPLTSLKMIYINGDSLAGFDDEQLTYQVHLPYGAATPLVTWDVADNTATTALTITHEEATIQVTNVGGRETDYQLTFTYALSNDCSLRDLLVRGTTISGFHADSLNYLIIYPAHTPATDLAQLADIQALPNDPLAQCHINGDPALYTIEVTAQDGTLRIYTIRQEILPSDEARIRMIYLDGKPLKGFSPDVFDYTYVIPQGAQAPEVTAVTVDSTADIAYGPIEGVDGGFYTELDGVAEDGTIITYSIRFNNANWSPSLSITRDQYIFYHIPGTNSYKAVTTGTSIQVAVYDIVGRRIMLADVPTVDPNCATVIEYQDGTLRLERVTDDAEGVIFELPYSSTPYFYCFFDIKNKRIAKGGKFLMRQ